MSDRSLPPPVSDLSSIPNHLIFLVPACPRSVFSILFLSLSLPAFLSPYCNGRLAINSALVWPETLLELNMNDWDCSSTCHWERRMRPRRGKGGSKYPTYETNHQAGVCYMLPRFYSKNAAESLSCISREKQWHAPDFRVHWALFIYIYIWLCVAVLSDPGRKSFK